MIQYEQGQLSVNEMEQFVKIFQPRQPKIQRILILMIHYPLESSCVCGYLLCCFVVANRFLLVSASVYGT